MARTASNIIVVPKFKRAAATKRETHPSARLWSLIGVIYLLFMLVGVIWASFSGSLLRSYLDHLMLTGITQRAADSFAAVLVKNAFPQLTLLLLCCIFANSAIGIPLLISIIVFRGLSSGVFSACLVKNFLLRGFFTHIVTFLPGSLLCGVALILIATEGIRASVSVNSVVLKGKTRNTKEVFEQFYHVAAIALGLSVIGAVLEAVLLNAFGSVFA